MKNAPATTVPTAAQSELAAELERIAQPVAVADLATATGQHPNTVREHLDALIGLGLVERSSRPSTGRGRPAFLYTLVRGADSQARASLLNALTGYLRETSQRPGATAEALGRSAANGPTWRPVTGIEGLTSAMRRWGFAPEADGEGRLRLRRCPLLEVAINDPDVVCGFHRGMTRGVAESVGIDPALVELTPFVEPRVCLVTLPATPVPDTGHNPDSSKQRQERDDHE